MVTTGHVQRPVVGLRIESPPPWVDYHYASRMAFSNGDRAVGKTTVLLSLIHACTSPEVSAVDTGRVRKSQPNPEENGASPEHRDKPMAEIRERLSSLRGRVVWLEPIDMARLPGPTNLLAAILARIEVAARPWVFPEARDRGEGDHGDRRFGMLGGYPEALDPLQKLQRLQTRVAVAWDGNLTERRGQLDPDSYAVELMRAELDRMSFDRTLSEVLDTLASCVFRGSVVRDPLFVITFDDVHLNPVRCLDTLKLLQLIAVPRFFAIVLGDIRIVEMLVNLKYSGDFAGVLDHRARLNPLSMPFKAIASRVGPVAANALRKLLPPAQRIRLEGMTRADALNFQPIGSYRSELPRLHALLHRCPAYIASDPNSGMAGRKIYSLREFLLYPASPTIFSDKDECTEKNLTHAAIPQRTC